ncbi:MAG TPA: molybdopterin molybdotransferase MoeA [Caulobacteraceae bacterium]|jgi:molybdopterin molybdotransferase
MPFDRDLEAPEAAAGQRLVSLDEALALVCAQPPLGRTERVALDDAGGRVLARTVRARRCAPSADVAAMDGFAVRDADLRAPSNALELIGEALAGRPFAGALTPGACVRVATGAPTPAGADRVVVQEEATVSGHRVFLPDCATQKRHIRLAGSDFRAGDVMVEAGAVLTAGSLMAIAAANRSHVDVFARPRVAILATGDELAEPGQAMGCAQIPDSVSIGIAEMARAAGANVVLRQRYADDLPSLRKAAEDAADLADLVVVTGGASVGPRDYARAMFEQRGLGLVFAKVAIKPGKPVWLGRSGGTLILGLPGNPTAAFVTARLFVIPLLARLASADPSAVLAWRPHRLASPLEATGEAECLVPAQRSPDGVRPFATRDSSAQRSLGSLHHLIRRRPLSPAAAVGEMAETLDA